MPAIALLLVVLTSACGERPCDWQQVAESVGTSISAGTVEDILPVILTTEEFLGVEKLEAKSTEDVIRTSVVSSFDALAEELGGAEYVGIENLAEVAPKELVIKELGVTVEALSGVMLRFRDNNQREYQVSIDLMVKSNGCWKILDLDRKIGREQAARQEKETGISRVELECYESEELLEVVGRELLAGGELSLYLMEAKDFALLGFNGEVATDRADLLRFHLIGDQRAWRAGVTPTMMLVDRWVVPSESSEWREVLDAPSTEGRIVLLEDGVKKVFGVTRIVQIDGCWKLYRLGKMDVPPASVKLGS